MGEKLSERLWRLLNEASERCALNSNDLCLLDEARNVVKLWEDAPEGTVTSFDTAGAWMIDKDDKRGIYAPLRHKRVRLVATPTTEGRESE